MPASSSEAKPEAPPLGKYLASTEKKTRDKAIKSLATFLSGDSQKAMPASERAKLWKGLFYCFWMSDKPIVQQDLSHELANLTLLIPSLDSALGFVHGFWEAMVREWAGIDRYRINKYYMLIRRFVNATFRLLLRHDWKPEACAELNGMMISKGGPLCPDDKAVPASLSYHLADIYLEELDKALDTTDNQLTLPLVTLLEPFTNLSARTSNKITYGRMQTALFTPLLDALAARSSSPTEAPDAQQRKRKRSSEMYPNLLDATCRSETGAKELTKDILKAIFEAAGHADTKDSNRRKMYALWKERTEDLEGPPEESEATSLS